MILLLAVLTISAPADTVGGPAVLQDAPETGRERRRRPGGGASDRGLRGGAGGGGLAAARQPEGPAARGAAGVQSRDGRVPPQRQRRVLARPALQGAVVPGQSVTGRGLVFWGQPVWWISRCNRDLVLWSGVSLYIVVDWSMAFD